MKKITLGLVILLIVLVSSSWAYWYDETPQYQTIVDYGARTDGQPVYVGYAQYGKTAASYSWIIVKLLYDESDNFTRMVFANGNANPSKSWTLRASYTYTE